MAALTGAPDSPQATVEALGPQPEIADASAPLATAEIRLQRPLVPLLAMLLLVLSLVAGISIIYYLFYSTLGLLAITFFWTRSLAQNITVQRRLRTKWAVVGDLIEEDFVIANEGRLPALWVEVRDDSTIPDFNPGVVRASGRGRAAVPRAYRLSPARSVYPRAGTHPDRRPLWHLPRVHRLLPGQQLYRVSADYGGAGHSAAVWHRGR